MCSALDVAKYFLFKTDSEIGEHISNLKLQKLLYLSQGFFLAIYDEPLFLSKIEAWRHGPVVPEIYQQYKGHGSDAIQIPKSFDVDKVSKRAQKLLDEVWDVYGQFSAWKLRDITHEHNPWKETKQGDVINIAKMKRYFKTLIKAT
jgi:uncharacterized phage-associated protein